MGQLGGEYTVTVDGVLIQPKGPGDYNLGAPMRSAIVGVNHALGYKEEGQVASIEFPVAHAAELNHASFLSKTASTVIVTLPNGQTLSFFEAWFAGEAGGNTEEGEITYRFEAARGELV